LTTIPGVSAVAAAVIVAEIGIDMTRSPRAGHLRSWAGLCPTNNESAGKRRSTRLRKGAPWLKTTLVQTAWYATRAKKGTAKEREEAAGRAQQAALLVPSN
jgi:transposase